MAGADKDRGRIKSVLTSVVQIVIILKKRVSWKGVGGGCSAVRYGAMCVCGGEKVVSYHRAHVPGAINHPPRFVNVNP